ncbi:GNAT family N-acetyltransferase [Labrenzia sp. DG1229]|uniref:GNAT family N-acetyltransferase n=1 Tax=Labrenzia sp. DG1229 TaxID=681847 RepID=UPI0006894A31|nr:GNAT family N-acetyltransferase [Labrenzia sp. DG1229]
MNKGEPGIVTNLPDESKLTLPGGVLRLRPTFPTDRLPIAVALADERVSRYLAALPCPLDDRTLTEYVDFLCGSGQVSRTLELNDEFAGIVSLSDQIMFWVAHEYWGQGVASSAVNWLVDHHFACPDGRPLKAEVHASNVGSINLLERLGFERTEQVKRRFSFVSETIEEFLVLFLSKTNWLNLAQCNANGTCSGFK